MHLIAYAMRCVVCHTKLVTLIHYPIYCTLDSVTCLYVVRLLFGMTIPDIVLQPSEYGTVSILTSMPYCTLLRPTTRQCHKISVSQSPNRLLSFANVFRCVGGSALLWRAPPSPSSLYPQTGPSYHRPGTPVPLTSHQTLPACPVHFHLKPITCAGHAPVVSIIIRRPHPTSAQKLVKYFPTSLHHQYRIPYLFHQNYFALFIYPPTRAP